MKIRMHRERGGWGGACLVTLAISVGAAGPLVMSAATHAAEPGPGAPVDPLVRFKELSAQAEGAYQARQYQLAIDKYLEANGVLASADVVYNIAYIYDHHLQRRDLAQDFYRRVIRMPESSPEIMELAVKRLAELEAQDKASVNVLKPGEAPAPAPSEPTAKPTPVDGVGDKVARDDGGPGAGPWVLVGVGGAAVIAAVVFGLNAQTTNDEFDAETDFARKQELESDGKAQALTSDLMGIGGGLFVAGGLIWYFAASGEDPAPQRTVELPPVRPLFTRDGFGVAVGGTL